MKDCLFCDIIENKTREILYENKFCIVIKDNFPVSPGHALVIPKKHTKNLFKNDYITVRFLYSAILQTRQILDKEYSPDGYNVGFNAGIEAGQTIMHTHVHIIPRYKGDVENPRGGVRGVVPNKQQY